MTNDEQRIAIAESCGWAGCYAAHGMLLGDPQPGKGIGVEQLPQYVNSLEAMHEAEEHIPTHQLGCYMRELAALVSGAQIPPILWASLYYFAHATAAQRAEAFLRATGRWKDEAATVRPNAEVSEPARNPKANHGPKPN